MCASKLCKKPTKKSKKPTKLDQARVESPYDGTIRAIFKEELDKAMGSLSADVTVRDASELYDNAKYVTISVRLRLGDRVISEDCDTLRLE